MLTEGWDANTVTHVLGIRAFGTQLLCEQVIGRALRRQSYQLNDEGLFDVEYADVFGIPFDFTAKPVVAPPQPPRETVQVKAMRPERDALEIRFPRVEGFRVSKQLRMVAKATTYPWSLIWSRAQQPCWAARQPPEVPPVRRHGGRAGPAAVPSRPPAASAGRDLHQCPVAKGSFRLAKPLAVLIWRLYYGKWLSGQTTTPFYN